MLIFFKLTYFLDDTQNHDDRKKNRAMNTNQVKAS